MQLTSTLLTLLLIPTFATRVGAQTSSDKPYEVRPPVAKTDLMIVRRASEILNSPAKWNCSDNRVCPAEAKTFSLFCALQKATDEVNGHFEHRGAAMQEARFVIEAVAPNWKQYNHRLMDYNNDPRTTLSIFKKCSGCWKIVSANV